MARAGVVVFALALWGAGRAVHAEAEVTGTGGAVAEAGADGMKVKLPEEVEKEMRELLQKMDQEKERMLTEGMQERIAALAKAAEVAGAPLGEEENGKLAAAGNEAVRECMREPSGGREEMARSTREVVDTQMAFSKARAKAMLDELLTVTNLLALRMLSKDDIHPEDEKAWKDALATVLTPAQSAAWVKKKTELEKAAKAQMSDFLNAKADMVKTEGQGADAARVAELEAALNLPKERMAELQKKVDAVAEQEAKADRDKAEKALLSLTKKQRGEAMKTMRNMSLLDVEAGSGSSDKSEKPWQKITREFLSPEEAKQVEADLERRRQRMKEIMGRLILTMLDEKVALTDAQRQRLEPIMIKQVGTEPRLFQEGRFSTQFNGEITSSLFAVAGSARPEEIRPILDKAQWEHWQAALQKKAELDMMDDAPETAVEPQPEPEPKARKRSEPEDVERAISDFLCKKAREREKRLQLALTLKAEDVTRITHLPAEAEDKLRTAACGQAVSDMALWDTNIQNMVRSQLGTVTPENVQRRLDSLQSYFFQDIFMGFQSESQDKGETIWDTAVKENVGEQAKAQWEVELKAREEYRTRGLAALALSTLDAEVPLKPAEWEQILKLTEQVVKDYQPDFQTYFQGPWYLQSNSMALPLVLIEDKDLTAILGAEKSKEWMSSNMYSNASMNVDYFKSRHAQRLGKGDGL